MNSDHAIIAYCIWIGLMLTTALCGVWGNPTAPGLILIAWSIICTARE